MYTALKHTFKLFFIFILFSFNACKENSTDPINIDNYMPLKIGNKWSYSSFTHNMPPNPENITETWEVVGSKLVDGEALYIIKRQFTIPTSINADSLYFFNRGNRLYQAFKDDESGGTYSAFLIADFSLDISNSFRTQSNMLYNVTVTSKSNDKMSFSYDAPGAVDEEYTNTFKKGTGLYESFSDAWGVGKRLVKTELK